MGTASSSILLDRLGARRWSPEKWRTAKDVVMHSSILQRDPMTNKYPRGVQGYRNSYNWAKQRSAPFRYGSSVLGGLGIGITVWDMTDNGVNSGNSLDLVMGFVSFIPKVGWVISGIYVVVDYTLVKTTDKKLGNHIEDAWNASVEYVKEVYSDVGEIVHNFFYRVSW